MTPGQRSQLIDSLLEGDLSEADFIRLEAELSVDRAARREYYDRITLSMLLENAAADPSSASNLAVELPTDDSVLRRRWKGAFALMALLAASLLAVVGMQWNTPTDRSQRTTGPQVSADVIADAENVVTGFAVISHQADAVWEDKLALADGSLVPAGELHLQSGIVQLELFSGVVLVVEGDATFAVLSPMEVAVSRGKVRASVPEPAHGFRIRTDEGEVVDLGTEFAVDVTADGSEVHVLDGEIEWHPRDSAEKRMEHGQAVRMTRDGLQSHLAADAQSFVGSQQLQQRVRARQHTGFERWKESSESVRRDPRLVAYYQVALSDLSNRRLPNRAADVEPTVREEFASEGAVVAASSAPGRWGQTGGALDFSPAGSRVRLTVPGEHRSLTLLCWVKINSLDRWYNSLFLTDGHEEGEPHWQIMEDGRLFFSVKKRDQFDVSKGESDKHIYYSPAFWDSSLSGQWLMIATVYDVDARSVTHYLNGQQLSLESIPEEYLVQAVRIGNASICNWGLPERDEPRFAVRNLNGSLDEFALFKAALSAEEIRKLYDDGKP